MKSMSKSNITDESNSNSPLGVGGSLFNTILKPNITVGSNSNSPLGVGGSLSSLSISIQHAMLTSEGKTNLEVNTEIEGNELLCLFGHSGAGKTTLLRILAGLLKPDKGRIVFNGIVWFDSEKKINMPPQERNIGYMFQDYALFPNMTVEKNIRFAQKEEDNGEVTKLMILFDIESLKHQHPSKLSGGQKQRVALARALASKPDLLLLDEPLSALDWDMRTSLQLEISKAHELMNSITMLVSHDIPEVFQLASSVIVLKNGSIIKSGNPGEVFEHNRPEYVYKVPTF
ncbi:MAG: ATP-binding cassette domain-containing protein [Paludibacter sp.]|nr:ATP-binding cassette domain-containing protein [Paludibacter sp.]